MKGVGAAGQHKGISRLLLNYGRTRIITPADEKTHGFNRVDDSPQIFNYVQMYILKISTRYAILNL